MLFYEALNEKLNWTVGCNKTVQLTRDRPRASLWSPNFPFEYPDNTNCFTVVKAPDGFTVVLEFEEFSLENEPEYVPHRSGEREFSFVKLIDFQTDAATISWRLLMWPLRLNRVVTAPVNSLSCTANTWINRNHDPSEVQPSCWTPFIRSSSIFTVPCEVWSCACQCPMPTRMHFLPQKHYHIVLAGTGTQSLSCYDSHRVVRCLVCILVRTIRITPADTRPKFP